MSLVDVLIGVSPMFCAAAGWYGCAWWRWVNS
jgi:hypothetical protein